MKLGQTFRAIRKNGNPVKNGTIYSFQSQEGAKAKSYQAESSGQSFVYDDKGRIVWISWIEAIAPNGRVIQFFNRHFTFEIT